MHSDWLIFNCWKLKLTVAATCLRTYQKVKDTCSKLLLQFATNTSRQCHICVASSKEKWLVLKGTILSDPLGKIAHPQGKGRGVADKKWNVHWLTYNIQHVIQDSHTSTASSASHAGYWLPCIGHRVKTLYCVKVCTAIIAPYGINYAIHNTYTHISPDEKVVKGIRLNILTDFEIHVISGKITNQYRAIFTVSKVNRFTLVLRNTTLLKMIGLSRTCTIFQ